VIWYWKPARAIPFRGELDKLFKGHTDLAVFRSSWDDPNALFLAVKGGRNKVSHANLDLGTFVMDALGVRWVMDLGGDSYSLPGYFGMFADNSPRWKYFRTSSHSHNVPTIDGRNQLLAGTVEIGRFKGGVDSPTAILDLSSAYARNTDKLERGIMLLGGRRSVLVQDEIRLKGTSEVAWGLTTPAKIRAAGDKATLTSDGKELIARILSPPGASFSAESAEQGPPQARNEGVSRLMIRMPEQSGQVRVAVLLSPVWSEGDTPPTPEVRPLKKW